MSVKAKCSCGYVIRVKDEHGGRTARCPSCGKPVSLPPSAQGVGRGGSQPGPWGRLLRLLGLRK